jgi:hypothetical protein
MAFYAVVPIGICKCVDMHKQQSRKVGAVIAVIVILTTLFCGAMVSMFMTNANTVDDAHSVATVPIDKNSRSTDAKLYYDNDTDEYFTITIDWWNPFNPTRRHKICKPDADTYMQQSNYL